MTIRCFLGIEIPEEIKEKIEDLQKQIRNLPLKAKLVERENLHITVMFIGEVHEDYVKHVSEKCKELLKKYEPFEIDVKGLQAIPTNNFIRVLALKVHDNNKITEISKDLAKHIKGTFHQPHLTLARVKSISNKDQVVKFITSHEGLHVGRFLVSSIKLFQSKLTPNGPIYKTLDKFTLGR